MAAKRGSLLYVDPDALKKFEGRLDVAKQLIAEAGINAVKKTAADNVVPAADRLVPVDVGTLEGSLGAIFWGKEVIAGTGPGAPVATESSIKDRPAHQIIAEVAFDQPYAAAVHAKHKKKHHYLSKALRKSVKDFKANITGEVASALSGGA